MKPYLDIPEYCPILLAKSLRLRIRARRQLSAHAHLLPNFQIVVFQSQAIADQQTWDTGNHFFWFCCCSSTGSTQPCLVEFCRSNLTYS